MGHKPGNLFDIDHTVSKLSHGPGQDHLIVEALEDIHLGIASRGGGGDTKYSTPVGKSRSQTRDAIAKSYTGLMPF